MTSCRSEISVVSQEGHCIHLHERNRAWKLSQQPSSQRRVGAIDQIAEGESLLFATHSLDERRRIYCAVDIEAAKGLLGELVMGCLRDRPPCSD